MDVLISIVLAFIYILIGYCIAAITPGKSQRIFVIHSLLFWPTLIVTLMVDKLCDIFGGDE